LTTHPSYPDLRSQAIALLCAAQARGELSVGAFEERFAKLQQATSAASIRAVVADLATPTPADPLPVLTRDEAYRLEQYDDYTPTELPAVSDEPLRLTAVFASTQRVGPWWVPPSIKCLVIMGSLTLDFREAMFEVEEVDLEISAYLGEVKILVPLDTKIEPALHAIMSSVKHSRNRKRHGERDTPAKYVYLHGDTFLADVSIKERAPDPINRVPFDGLADRVKGWLGKGGKVESR